MNVLGTSATLSTRCPSGTAGSRSRLRRLIGCRSTPHAVANGRENDAERRIFCPALTYLAFC